MPPSSGPRLYHALLYIFLLTSIAAAQQQQRNTHRRSPPENAALDPSKRGQEPRHGARISTAHHRNGKDTAIVPTNERALATFAPADESAPAVRAHPAKPSVATAGISRQLARSLQDWKVEDIILLATVDGKIYARERDSGAPRWELEVDRPMVETVYHKNNKSDYEQTPSDDDFLWIVEPSQDGALYVYAPGSRLGMQKLGLTVKQLVEELSPYAGDDPPVVYTAEKKNTLYSIDAATGNILKMFSSAGSVTNNERSCRKVNALESLDDIECEPIGTLTIGRTEYTVGIQDKNTGDPICTISYFEWGPNNRDKDLQSQHATTMDNKYVYSKHDGGIMALEHGSANGPRRTTSSQSLMYSHKFSSPVARVYDVVRPYDLNDGTEDASLVVLPQPIGPVNDQWPTTDNVFVNCTEAGSWYALSEQSYPLVTDGASRALCYTDDVFMGRVSLGDTAFNRQRAKLVGVHPLTVVSPSESHNIGLIGGSETAYPIDPPSDVSDKESAGLLATNPPNQWTSSRPSPYTIAVAIIFLLSLLSPVRKEVSRIEHWLQKHMMRLIGKPAILKYPAAIQTDLPQQIIVEQSASASEERKVRFPEPAEETIFPQDGKTDLEEKVDEVVEEVRRDSSPETAVESEAPRSPSPPNGAEATTPKPEKEKKARRGVRGGRKVKEKKMEQEQAQQRRRANSQNQKKPNDITNDVTDEDDVGPSPDTPSAQVISVDASESPTVSGKIQINNLVINTDRLIGRGSAGTCVFEGSFGKRDVAVKRMLSQYYELASQEVVFLQENDDHPNVIRYYCQERDQNFLYIAVELCQASLWDLFYPPVGEDDRSDQLGEILTAIQQDVPGALFQIALGLRHLHARRIIHRDIKPQNILIARPNPTRKGPHLLISDFGLCKTLPENASTLVDPTGNAGTSGWKAPELISQPKDTASNNGHSTTSTASDSGATGGVKRAADVFSLGCLFFWVLTGGCHPFDDREGWAQIREFNIKKNNLQNMHKLDLGNDTEEPMQLITQMLGHRPEDRPTVDGILEHPFFWKPKDRLAFLCDVSDHFEREPRDPPSWQLEILEAVGPAVIEKGDFLKVLPSQFIDTLGKQRKYTGSRMLDLLRALRNKRNHYEDMPENVKRQVGPLPGGYLQFWTTRFPKLLMACYEVVKECELEYTDRFRGYFEVKE